MTTSEIEKRRQAVLDARQHLMAADEVIASMKYKNDSEKKAISDYFKAIMAAAVKLDELDREMRNTDDEDAVLPEFIEWIYGGEKPDWV